MSVCTFFGHRECPEKIKTVLKSTVEALIVNREVDVFYVGCQGQFDGYVRSVLRELAAQYPHIRYAVVLSSMPGEAEPEADYPTLCSRRDWKRCIPNSPSPGGTGGCWSGRILR